MSKAEKLAGKLLTGRSDRNFSFDDLCYLIERAGFERRGGKGSHRIYAKEGVGEIHQRATTRRRTSKPYQVRQVRELLVKYKIELA
jgi:hypothetical protein